MTSPQKIPQLAFNAGEISPELQGRLDLAKYASGAGYIINFIPRDYGGLERRPGFGYIAEVKDHTKPPRIIDFIFNDVQAYVIEMGDLYARFFMLGGQLANSGTPYEITTPFAQADLDRIQYAQSKDVMWLVHGDYQPQTLTRSAHTSWTMADWASDTGPFLDPNATAITMTPGAVTGSTTLTASSAYFDADMVGTLFRIEEDNTNGYGMWEPAKAYSLNDVVRYGLNVYICTDAGTSGAVAPVHTTGKRFDGSPTSAACEWNYLHSGYGICRVTAYTDSTHVNVTVLSRLPSTSAVTNWREGAFSDYRGWPSAVALFQQRLWLAKDQTVYGSVTGDFSDFTPGANADDAVTFTISAKTANPIRALAEGRALYAFTSKRVYAFTGTNGGPIKPDDVVAKAVTTQGSNGVQPVNVDRAVLFVDQSGKRVQELGFQLDADEDAARDISKLSGHILKPGG